MTIRDRQLDIQKDKWEPPFEDGTKGVCWCCTHLYEDEVLGGYYCFFGHHPVCLRDECYNSSHTHTCRFDPPKFKCIKREDVTIMIRGKDRRVRRYD